MQVLSEGMVSFAVSASQYPVTVRAAFVVVVVMAPRRRCQPATEA